MEETSLNSVRCTTSNLQTRSTNTNPVSRSHGPLQENHKKNRKILYRFQIDYIVTRKNQGIKIYDTPSINTMRITTDHKPVVNFLKIHLPKSKSSTTVKLLNIASIRYTNNLELYKNKVEECILRHHTSSTQDPTRQMEQYCLCDHQRCKRNCRLQK